MIKPIKSVDVGDGWESKDVYLQKPGEPGYVGLHATGATQEDGFHNIEAWFNVYDDDKKFVGSVSRIFTQLENVVEELEADGYVVVEWDKT